MSNPVCGRRNGAAVLTDTDGVTSAQDAAGEDFGVETRTRQNTETRCLHAIVFEQVAHGVG